MFIDRKKTSKKNQTWMLICTDLFSLLVTMFVTIYSFTNHNKTEINIGKSSTVQIAETSQKKVYISHFIEHMLAELSVQIQNNNISLSNDKHSISISIPTSELLKNTSITKSGAFLLNSITQTFKATPPTSIEVIMSTQKNKFNYSMEKACKIANHITNHTKHVKEVYCLDRYNKIKQENITIKLVE